jgi:hypothetical protein
MLGWHKRLKRLIFKQDRLSPLRASACIKPFDALRSDFFEIWLFEDASFYSRFAVVSRSACRSVLVAKA